ncbi:lysoplasmalogenase [Urechidicola sp. KH5]
MKKSSLLLLLFAIISLSYVIGLILENQTIIFVFKPLIMLSLMGYYSSMVAKPNKLFLGAIFFSFLGDVFLLYDLELNFILGLSSFLIAHLLYISVFKKLISNTSIAQKVVAFIPFTGLYVFLMWYLKDVLGAMQVPVFVYGAVICIFGYIAFLHYVKRQTALAGVLVVGSLLFIVSDSLLAINKFYYKQVGFDEIIIITYILAQYSICKFMVNYQEAR